MNKLAVVERIGAGTRPSIPKPELADVPTFIAQVAELRKWSHEHRDIEWADEIRRRIAGFEKYVKDRDSRRKLAGEQRRTEIVIGDLLGPVEERQRTDLTVPAQEQLQVKRTQRHEFRQLAEHASEVEALIAEGVVSRPKILALIGKTAPGDIEVPTGTFGTIVADPPWQYGNTSTRGAAANHYGTMTIEKLVRLSVEVDEWAAPDCHLYLWTTNNFIREAFTIVDAWGFEYKTMLTWVKKNIGMGNYFRSRTEHVLFATRGNVGTLRRDISNVIEGDRTRHSKKPGQFFDTVMAQSPGRYMEMFARERRLDPAWDYWGNEA
jgi:N6-adenosine-specific RNA methylase IME4